MTDAEQEILKALLELDAAARGTSTRPKTDLISLLDRLDQFAAQLPASEGELRHFLQRRSYEKARLYLEGKAAERGSCGH